MCMLTSPIQASEDKKCISEPANFPTNKSADSLVQVCNLVYDLLTPSLISVTSQLGADHLDQHTPFAVHYEKICIHLREKANNCVQIHSLTSSWSFLDPALSDVARHNASCRWSVHSERVRDLKIIFLLVLKSSYDSLSVFEWYSVSSRHFAFGQKTLKKRMKGIKFTECKFWQNRCSIENHYLHIEYKKHWIVCTSALMAVLFILMSSRDAIELQTMW